MKVLGHARFRHVDPMLEQREGAAHLVTGQLVGITEPDPQSRVGPNQLNEPPIQHRHGAALGAGRCPRRFWQVQRLRVTMSHGMLALPTAALAAMGIEHRKRVIEVPRRHMERRGAGIERFPGAGIPVRIADQWKIVCGVGTGAGEAEPFLGLGDDIWQPGGITSFRRGGEPFQRLLRRQDRPGDCGRVTAIDDQRLEAVMAHILCQPSGTAFLDDLRALLDPASVEDHHRNRETAVLGSPPARCPIRAALLFERAVAQEGHQALSRQGHMHVLQCGEAQVSAFGDCPCGMGARMAAQRHRRFATRIDGVGIEVRTQTGQPSFATIVPSLLAWGHVPGQRVNRLDGRDAVSLPHQPSAGRASQRIGKQISHEGRHHVERSAGMSFRHRLEIMLHQRGAG